MIEVITPEAYGEFKAQLTEMHRLRHRVFRERLGWDVTSVDGLERDEFDDLDPVYLTAIDAREAVIGTWRLLPTTGSYMLNTVFSRLLEGAPAPCDDGIWETSRFAVETDEAHGGLCSPNGITSELFCGLVEYGLANGVHEIVTVYDIRIARLLRHVGCRPYWQSKPQRIGCTVAVAGRFEVSERVLAELRQTAGIAGSVLRSAPATFRWAA